MRQTDLFEKIIVDNFAGGGGASTGIELACGRPVTIAINHDPDAILLHRTNHPYTEHLQASVWDVDPKEVCRGRKVGLAWFSPDCKHFSKAKGAALVDEELAQILNRCCISYTICTGCEECVLDRFCDMFRASKDWLDWLRSPVEESDG